MADEIERCEPQSPSFETGTGESSTEYASEGSDFSPARHLLDSEEDRQLLHQQYQLIRRLTDENRLLRQADLENEEDCSELRLRLAATERRLVDLENLRRLRATMEEDNDALQSSLAQEKGRCVALEARVNSLEVEKAKLLARLGAAEEEEYSLRKRLEATQDEYNAALQLCSGREDTYLADFREMLAQSAERTGALEQQLSQLMNVCNELRTEKSQLESELADIRSRQRCVSPLDGQEGSILKPYLCLSDVYGEPVSQSTPSRVTNSLQRELLQMDDGKSLKLDLDKSTTQCLNAAVSPTPSDGSVAELTRFGTTGDLLASFRDHFDAKIKLASQHVADLSGTGEPEMEPAESTSALNEAESSQLRLCFEEKLKRLVESRNKAVKKVTLSREELKRERQKLAEALERREESDKLATELACECESLRQQLEAAEASRTKMVQEIQQTSAMKRKPRKSRLARNSGSQDESLGSSRESLVESCRSTHSPTHELEHPVSLSPVESVRRRLIISSQASEEAEPIRVVKPSHASENVPVTLATGRSTRSCLSLTCRILFYLLLVTALIITVVFIICPACRFSSTNGCCSCPPAWLRKFLGENLVASPVKMAPL